MSKIRVLYEGDLHTQALHLPSGETLHTDAPKDNGGEGKTFSPTDLVGAALITCMATVMGLYAKRHNIDLRGMTLEVTKKMSSDAPRRIVALETEIVFPKNITDEEKKKLLHIAKNCPVHHSLHPDIQVSIT